MWFKKWEILHFEYPLESEKKGEIGSFHLMDVLVEQTYFRIFKTRNWYRQYINSEVTHWIRIEDYDKDWYSDWTNIRTLDLEQSEELNQFYLDQFDYRHSAQYEIDERNKKINSIINIR